jgi:hypothetical protein
MKTVCQTKSEDDLQLELDDVRDGTLSDCLSWHDSRNKHSITVMSVKQSLKMIYNY